MVDSDIIIRNFKLSILSDSEMDKRVYLIYKCLEHTFKDLYMYKNIDYNHGYTKYFTYYGKNMNDLYFSYQSDRKVIMLNYDNTCKILENSFSLSTICTIDLITWYLNFKYGINGEVYDPMRQLDLDKTYGKRSNLKEYGKLTIENNTHESI